MYRGWHGKQAASSRHHGGAQGTVVTFVGCVSGLLAATATLRALLPSGGQGLAAVAPGGTAPMRVEDVLLVALGWLGAGLALWLALGSALGMLSLLPGAIGRAAAAATDRVTPAVVRRTLTLVLGAAVGSTALPAPAFSASARLVTASAEVPAGADVRPQPSPGRTTVSAFSRRSDAAPERSPVSALSVRPGPSPEPSAAVAAYGADQPGPAFRPTIPPPRVADQPGPAFRPTPPPRVADPSRSRLLAPTPRPRACAHDLVTVRRGDTLWSITRRHLGREATDLEVAREWPRWYAANRAVVGDDPNAIRPGQLLRPPAAAQGHARATSDELGPALGPTRPSADGGLTAGGARP